MKRIEQNLWTFPLSQHEVQKCFACIIGFESLLCGPSIEKCLEFLTLVLHGFRPESEAVFTSSMIGQSPGNELLLWRLPFLILCCINIKIIVLK